MRFLRRQLGRSRSFTSRSALSERLLHRSMRVEPLESRRLLAIDAYFDAGVLTIAAYDEAAIVVSSQDGQVLVNAATPANGSVAAADVRQISVIRDTDATAVDFPTSGEDFNALDVKLLVTTPGTSNETIDAYGRALLQDVWDKLTDSSGDGMQEWYAEALLGSVADEVVGKSIGEVKTIYQSGRWRSLIETTELPTLAQTLGVTDLQEYVDARLGGAGLASMDVRKLSWLGLDVESEKKEDDGGSKSSGDGKTTKSVSFDAGEAGLGGTQLLDAVLTSKSGEGESGGQMAMSSSSEGPEGVDISIDDSSARENEGSMNFDIRVDGGEGGGPWSVDYNTSDGSATAVQDYVAESGTIVIPPEAAEGNADVSLDIDLQQDTELEPNETFHVTLDNLQNLGDEPAEGVNRIVDGDAVGTIIDDDGGADDPIISIGDVTVDEDAGTATFTVSISAAPISDATVDYATSDGTAIAGQDYTSASGTITFPAGSADPQTISVPIIDDLIDEINELFYVTLSNPTNADLGDQTGTGTIVDDDTPPTVSISDAELLEGAPGLFYVTLSHASDSTVVVPYGTIDGTAIAPDDYLAKSGIVVFEPGETEKIIAILAMADEITDPDEEFYVQLGEPVNATIGDGSGTGTIVEELTSSGPPSLIVETEPVEEPNGPAYFYVALTAPAPAGGVSFSYATSDGSATAGADYTSTSGEGFIAEGEIWTVIEVPIIDDELEEGEEIFHFDVSEVVGATAEVTHAIGIIIDDDLVRTLSIDDVTVDEDAGTATFTVSLSGPSSDTITVAWQTEDGSAVAGDDYEAASGVVVFEPGETEKTVSVTIIDDVFVEPDETFTVVLSDPVNAEIDDGEGEGTIVDNDDPLQIYISDVTVNEEDGTATFEVVISSVPSDDVTVDWATSDGSAEDGEDYTGGSGVVTFPAGSSSPQFITVGIIDDDLDEEDEDFFVNLSNPVNATIGDEQGVGTIVDNDLPAISVSDAYAFEGDDDTATFQVSISSAPEEDVTVEFSLRNGTATVGEDYVAQTGTITFPAGSTEPQYITVAILDDTIDEDDETFYVDLSNPVNATIDDGTATGTIYDDDDPPVLVIWTTPGFVDEGGGSVTFFITLSEESERTVTVHYQTVDESAIAPWDYIAAMGVVTFAPGETQKTFVVGIVDDNVHEWDEIFYGEIFDAENATIGEDRAQVIIYDDDPLPTVSISDVAVWEPNGPAVFVVTLSNPTALGDVTFEYATADGTALAGADYDAVAGVGVIPPYATWTTVSVPIIDDYIYEPTEEFYLNISNAIAYEGNSVFVPVTITDPQGVGTIYDDEVLVAVDIDTDSNNDGTISTSDDPIEEQIPGRYVMLNDDDDNGNVQFDYDDQTVAGENDLARVELHVSYEGYAPALNDYTFVLEVSSGASFIRIWDTEQKGTEIASGTTWSFSQVPTAVFVEGIEVGSSMIDFYALDKNDDERSRDRVRVTVIQVDLDIDSDNNNDFDDPARTTEEDRIEDADGSVTLTGKRLAVNSGNQDGATEGGDDVPDFADGIDLFDNQGADASRRFIPVILELSQTVDLEAATVSFDYSASDPSQISRTLDANGEYVYSLPPSGALRLWSRDGDESRAVGDVAEGGDFILANHPYAIDELPEHAQISERVWRFYLEAVRPSTEIGDHRVSVDLNPTGNAAPTSWAHDALRSTALDWQYVEVGTDDTLTPTRELLVSYTSPTVTITQYDVTNVHWNSDYTVLIGDIAVAGNVDSVVADYTPGALGTIDTVQVYLGDTYTEFATVPVSVSKSSGDGPGYLRAYDYSGSFAHVFSEVPLQIGANLIEVRATDKLYGESGNSQWVVDITLDEPSVVTREYSFDLAFASTPDAGVVDQIDLEVSFDGSTSTVTLTETGPSTLEFSGAGVVVTFPNGANWSPSVADVIEVAITWLDVDFEASPVTLFETDVNTFNLTGTHELVFDPAQQEDYDGYSPLVGAPAPINATYQNELHPYFVELLGPAELIRSLQGVETEAGLRPVKELPGERFVLGTIDGESAAVLATRLKNVAANAAALKIEDLDDFALGFAKGLVVDGLWGSIEGIIGIVKFVGNVAWNYNHVAIQWRLLNGDRFEKEIEVAAKVAGVTVETVKTLAILSLKVNQFQEDYIEALWNGDAEELEALNSTAQEVAIASADIVLEFLEALANASAEDKGRVVGMVVYEVLEAYLTAGAAKVTKVQLLNKIKTSTRIAGDAVANVAVQALFNAGGRLAKALDFVTDITNRMCFVAGTKVHTNVGLRNIEDIQPGDRVHSRDEITGDPGVREVVRTFVTHPSRLYTICYRNMSNATSNGDWVQCTGEHPFFVIGKQQCVPACELMPGDALALIDGHHAVVTEVSFEDAPEGECFTTYNFEVADYHTYFVGNAGVWVHNAGKYCDGLKMAYNRWRTDFGASPEYAFERIMPVIRRLHEGNRISRNETATAIGAVIQKMAVDDPTVFGPNGLPGNFWTKKWVNGQPTNAWDNIGDHIRKHVYGWGEDGDLAKGKIDGIDDAIAYVRRALDRRDNPPSIYKERTKLGFKERFYWDDATKECWIVKIEGPDAGALKSLYKFDLKNMTFEDYIAQEAGVLVGP